MKKKHVFIAVVALLSSTTIIKGQSLKPNFNDTVLFAVEMECKSCKLKIEKNIAFEKGVKALDVSLEKNAVQVVFDTRKTNVENLQRGFKKIGFEASVIVIRPSKIPNTPELITR